MWLISLALAAEIIWAPAPVPSLDPLRPWGPADRLLHSLVHDRLYHPTRTGFRSNLVEETVQSGTEARIRMRRGGKWHDGEAIDAEDLCFTIDALMHPNSQSAWAPSVRARVAGCLVVPDDPLSAVVSLWGEEPIEHTLAVPLLPAHAYPAFSGDPRILPIGCGPYRAETHPDGWSLTAMGPAPFRQLLWASLAEPHIAASALLAGKGVAVPWVPPERVDAMRSGGVGLFPWDRQVAWTLALDAKRAPFDDVVIRQAVDAAIDRDVLSRAIAGSIAGPSPDWPLVSGPFWFDGARENAGVPPTDHDPLLAVSLLEGAGFARGLDGHFSRDGSPLELTIGVPSGLGFDPQSVAQAFIGTGITVRIESIGPDAWTTSALAGGQAGHLHALLIPRDVFPTDDPGPWVHQRTEREGWFNPFNVHTDEIDALVLEARQPGGLQGARALHGALADQRAFLFLFEERRRTAWVGSYQPWLSEPFDGWSKIREWKRLD